jgi:isopropylmalate/isohomocitrate dehydrogenase-like protein
MGKKYKVVISPGDGIGHEIIGWAKKTLEVVSDLSGLFAFEFIPIDLGLTAYKKTGEAISQESLNQMRSADASLVVAIAGADIPKNLPNPIRVMRKELDTYANIRPMKDYPRLAQKDRRADLIVVRENTEGFYSGIEYRVGSEAACAVRVITRSSSERIGRVALRLARTRRKKVTVIHKLAAHKMSDGLFVDAVERVGKEEFPEIEIEEMLVDAAAMHLIRDPMHFDVILATNAYGDILADEAAQITGGIGLAPSSNIGENAAVFEPAHGTASGRAGKGIANPIATVLSAKLMLDYLGEVESGNWVQKAVENIIEEGKVLTPDIGGKNTTDQVGEAIIGEIGSLAEET